MNQNLWRTEKAENIQRIKRVWPLDIKLVLTRSTSL